MSIREKEMAWFWHIVTDPDRCQKILPITEASLLIIVRVMFRADCRTNVFAFDRNTGSQSARPSF